MWMLKQGNGFTRNQVWTVWTLPALQHNKRLNRLQRIFAARQGVAAMEYQYYGQQMNSYDMGSIFAVFFPHAVVFVFSTARTIPHLSRSHHQIFHVFDNLLCCKLTLGKFSFRDRSTDLVKSHWDRDIAFTGLWRHITTSQNGKTEQYLLGAWTGC